MLKNQGGGGVSSDFKQHKDSYVNSYEGGMVLLASTGYENNSAEVGISKPEGGIIHPSPNKLHPACTFVQMPLPPEDTYIGLFHLISTSP